MLFNSYVFIFIFLPVTLIGFHLFCCQNKHLAAISWLTGASLFFYGWWNPVYLVLILGSIAFNYTIGLILNRNSSKAILTLGVIVNLGLIGYYKYTNFFIGNVNATLGTQIHLERIILPLAISFFTFQQIAYLVDAYSGKVGRCGFINYCLFVTFFPQLIAGPIVHHKEMLAQFSNNALSHLKSKNLAIGLSIFFIGLFKKVVLADTISIHATPVFDAAEQGVMLTFFEAWGGALAYTFQLYFDFSGYSDMALGIARMLGIVLPLNFFSPYKAHNIIEFWRCWHITLSRFLRDYLYFPLGGNRKGPGRRYINLLLVMAIGGLWHGAGWTFILWGILHGIYLCFNHLWIDFKKRRSSAQTTPEESLWKTWGARILTFICIVIAWVLFRCESIAGVTQFYTAMFGGNGISLAPELAYEANGILTHLGFRFDGMFIDGAFGDPKQGGWLILISLLLVWFAPNTVELYRHEKPALGLTEFDVKGHARLVWKTSWIWLVATTLIATIALMLIQKHSEFLYFQF
jgi:D-alanyl-lipoteichoic acid acyltransferase DltB (MBOAT superfamily)